MKRICAFSAVAALLLGTATPPAANADSLSRHQAGLAPKPVSPGTTKPVAQPQFSLAATPDPEPVNADSPVEVIRWGQLSERIAPAYPSRPSRRAGIAAASQWNDRGRWDGGTQGPVRVVVSLPQQKAFVYRGGALLWTSPVSTGKRGHGTPAGTFRILQKKVKHRSNIYDASMPYMQRLTHSGIALHAGHVPGYRASHGCIRLPYGKARKLYDVTRHGTTVVVTNQRVA